MLQSSSSNKVEGEEQGMEDWNKASVLYEHPRENK